MLLSEDWLIDWLKSVVRRIVNISVVQRRLFLKMLNKNRNNYDKQKNISEEFQLAWISSLMLQKRNVHIYGQLLFNFSALLFIFRVYIAAFYFQIK